MEERAEKGLKHPIGWEKHGHRTVAIDFDGVIHSYTSPWTGADVIPDKPIPGAIEYLRHLMENDIRVVIFSTRATTPEGTEAIRDWLIDWSGGSVDCEITAIKPAALLYIDDRAWQFTGNNFPTLREIKDFLPHNKKPMGQIGKS